ncbi:Auxin responsive SAUR protein [Corchorus olitorius]|uniref:Auxin responsive SAUR protein n=1 Tax=Corchorus olitorius TaxID=93759 RepID=A0A1R3HTC4_9ROSI|nr:Auxin responsive SAUR protein [Corchorus olitorius]
MKNWEQRHTGLVVLRNRLTVRKLRRVFSEFPLTGRDQDFVEFDDEHVEETNKIPKDVKEGQFAVIAVKGGNPKRFILELSYLRNPAFLKLLEQAKEEYGFQQMGALTVPCHPQELHKILEDGIKGINC